DEHRWLSSTATMTLAIVVVLLLDTLDLGSANRFIGVINNLLVTFCVASFVFLPEGTAGAVLNSPLMAFIGKLSYSLYLWQQLFFKPFSTAPIRRFPLNLCVTFAAAC